MSFESDLKNLVTALHVMENYSNGKEVTMLGQVGELVAKEMYKIELCNHGNEKGIDGRDENGNGWQIKVSFKEGRSSCNCPADYLPVDRPYGYLVLTVKRDGTVDEIYNGPWNEAEKLLTTNERLKAKDRTIRKNKLRDLNAKIPADLKLPRR